MREKSSPTMSFSSGLVGIVCAIAGIALLGDGLTGAVIGPPTNVSLAGGAALAITGLFSIAISRHHATRGTLENKIPTPKRTAYVVLDTGALIEAYHEDPTGFSDILSSRDGAQYIITQQVYAELRTQRDANRSYDNKAASIDNSAASPIRSQGKRKEGGKAGDWKTRTDNNKLVPWTMMAAIDSLIASGAIHKIDALMPLERQTALIERLKGYQGNPQRNTRIGQGDFSCVYFAEMFCKDGVAVVSPDSDIPMVLDISGKKTEVYQSLREYRARLRP